LFCGGCTYGLSTLVSKQGRSQIESVSSAHTIERADILLGKMLLAGNMSVMEGRMP
jgi:hypothetical protein